MAAVDDRNAQQGAQAGEVGEDFRASRLVERREWFIHEEEAGLAEQGAGQWRRAGARRRRGWWGRRCSRRLRPSRSMVSSKPMRGRARRAAHAVAQIGIHAHVRKQQIVLKDDADAARLGRAAPARLRRRA